MKKLFYSLLIGLLLISPAQSSIQWTRADYFDNAGGLNNSFSAFKVADNEAADLQNVVFTTSGSFKTRDGYAKINSTTYGASASATGLFFYKITSGSKWLVMVSDDDKIRKMEYVAGSGLDGTWDDITGALSFNSGQNNIASFSVGEDILIIEDGINTTAPYKWTGTGNASALSGSPPNCTMVAYHKRQAFCAGNDSNPSTLYFSDVGNIENWTTALSGNVSVENNDGSVIRAIMPGLDALYIWKDKSIWRLSGDDKDNYELERMVSGVGTLSSASVGIIGNDFVFTDGQGDTYIYDGGIKVRLVSTKIDATMDESNFSRFAYVKSLIYNKDYYASISSSGNSTNDIVIMFDTFNLAWTKFDGMNINSMAVCEDSAGEEALCFGDYTGFSYLYPSGTSDAGTAIDMFYITKQYRFPDITLNKTLRVQNVFVKQAGSYSLNVELRKDFISSGTTQTVSLASTSSSYGSAVYGVDRYGGQNIITGRLEWDTEGQFFQIKYSNSTVDQPIEVRGWNIYIEPSDRI